MNAVRNKISDLSELDSLNSIVYFFINHNGPRVLVALVVLSIIVKMHVWGIDAWDCAIVTLFFSLRGFLEWVIHSYLHHARPIPFLKIRIKTPIYTMHVAHHRSPSDPSTFLFGPLSNLLVFLVVLSTAMLFFWDMGRSMTVAFAFSLCLFIHEVVHVFCHSAIQPKSRTFSKVLSTHRRHHSINSRKWLGVTSGLADNLLKTGR